VVYGIVQNAGGSIAVESAPGLGTTLRLELPVAEGAVLPAPVVVVKAGPAVVHALRVMVVDDEPAVRELLTDILRSLGHEPESFDSGGTALEHFEPGRFELLFTDLGMPGMTGWELARAVRTRDGEVTIAIITGWGAEISMDSVREAGGDAVIAKPFTIEDIEGLAQLVRDRREKRAA
jgi:CheY-like chemotaxis protein